MRKFIQRYSKCFVCGDKNEAGLKIDFFYENGKAKAEYMPTHKLEGYKDILHGGIISSLLDEVMIKAIIAKGIVSLTLRMEVKFRNLAKIDEKLLLEGWIKEERRKLLLAEGKACKHDGTLIAEAQGTYYKVKGEMKELLESCLEMDS